jgi:hypothetical protein
MLENFNYSSRQIEKYFKAATKDFIIARDANLPEVSFKFAYDSLIKLAVTVCAKNRLRIKARTGHHIILLQKFSEFLKNPDIEIFGNKMRSKRNRDLYDGGIFIDSKEVKEYVSWLNNVVQETKDYLFASPKLFK